MVPPLLAKLQDPKTDWGVLTEMAWALGKIPGKRSIQPLYDLDKKRQAIRDPDNVTLKKLKEAVFWAISIAEPSCYNFSNSGMPPHPIAHICMLRQLLI